LSRWFHVISPKNSIEKSRPRGQSKNNHVANHPEKENASPTVMKDTKDGKLLPKNGKTFMFTLSYPIYHINYNIVDDIKKSRANITYFDFLKLTQQRYFLLKPMNERNSKAPTIPRNQPRS